MVTIEDLRKNIPPGMYRVIRVDIVSEGVYHVVDKADKNEAIGIATTHNAGRKKSDDFYYVYGPDGKHVYGQRLEVSTMSQCA